MGSIPNINSRARPSVCVWVLSCKITITFRANISRPQLEIAWHLIVKLFSSFAIIAKSHLLLLHRRLMTPSNSIHPALPPIPASKTDRPTSQSVSQAAIPFYRIKYTSTSTSSSSSSYRISSECTVKTVLLLFRLHLLLSHCLEYFSEYRVSNSFQAIWVSESLIYLNVLLPPMFCAFRKASQTQADRAFQLRASVVLLLCRLLCSMAQTFPHFWNP